jgi:hypothetical protein
MRKSYGRPDEWSHTGGEAMGGDRDAAERIIDTARRYRDALRIYMREQAALAADGVDLEAMVWTNWERFAAVADLEEELFALLDAADDAALLDAAAAAQ